MKRFPKLLSRAQQTYTTYQDQYAQLLEKCQKLASRKEYARGGLGFGLGYYWANPVKDRIIGGVHRGRLLKRINVSKKPEWEYYFDKNGVLIAALENFSIYTVMHFVLRDIDEYIWEISFRDDGSFERVCVTYYYQNQIEFEVAFDSHSFDCNELFLPHVQYEAWLFEYLEDGFIEFEWFSNFLYPDKTKDFFAASGWPLYQVRNVYKRHSKKVGEEKMYDFFESNETLGQCKFMGTYTFK